MRYVLYFMILLIAIFVLVPWPVGAAIDANKPAANTPYNTALSEIRDNFSAIDGNLPDTTSWSRTWIAHANDIDARTDIEVLTLIDVRDYGADPADGANGADDTAVQAALAVALTEINGCVPVLYFPTGVWDIDTLTISDQIHIIGDGPHASILDARGSSGYVIDITVPGSVVLRNFGMVGPNGGVRAEHNIRGVYENLWAGKGTDGYAYHMKGCLLTRMVNCFSGANGWQFDSSLSDLPDVGFYWEDGSIYFNTMSQMIDCKSTGGEIYDCYISHAAGGGGGDVTLLNCEMEGRASSANIGINGADGCRIIDGYSELGTLGIEIVDASLTVIDGHSLQQPLSITGDGYCNAVYNMSVPDLIIGEDQYDTVFYNCRLRWGVANAEMLIQNYTTRFVGCSYNNPSYYNSITKSDVMGFNPPSMNYNNSFEMWNAANTLPLGNYSNYGSTTVARESTIKHSGTYSAKLTCGGDPNSEGLKFNFATTDGSWMNEDWVTVAFWAYRPTATSTDDLYIQMYSSYPISTYATKVELPANTWTRVERSIRIGTLGASSYILVGFYGGTSGQIYYIDDFSVTRGRVAAYTRSRYEGYAERFISEDTTVTTTGPTDNVDVSNASTVYVNTSSNNVTIGGFTGGVPNQIIHVVITNATNNTILEHAEGTGNQDVYLESGADETKTASYGGWTLICNGTHWYQVK